MRMSIRLTGLLLDVQARLLEVATTLEKCQCDLESLAEMKEKTGMATAHLFELRNNLLQEREALLLLTDSLEQQRRYAERAEAQGQDKRSMRHH